MKNETVISGVMLVASVAASAHSYVSSYAAFSHFFAGMVGAFSVLLAMFLMIRRKNAANNKVGI